MPDKRAARRHRKRVKVRYGADGPKKMAFAADISETGVQLRTNNVIQPGSTIALELTFADCVFTLWGRVCWARRVPPELAHTVHCGMGVEFLEPDPEWLGYFRQTFGDGGRAR